MAKVLGKPTAILGPRFFASLAAFVYCFLPFVIAEADKLRRRAAALREPC